MVVWPPTVDPDDFYLFLKHMGDCPWCAKDVNNKQLFQPGTVETGQTHSTLIGPFAPFA